MTFQFFFFFCFNVRVYHGLRVTFFGVSERCRLFQRQWRGRPGKLGSCSDFLLHDMILFLFPVL
jgi:hypothetical protein